MSLSQANQSDQASHLFAADQQAVTNLITGSHILAHHNVLDGFGHLTIRSPTDPTVFYYTSTPAAIIASPKDYVIFNIKDGTPLNSSFKVSTYSEHYIHAAFYAAYPELTSVVHSHARETLPFGILDKDSSKSLRAVMHTGAFLGQGVPVWDVRDVYPSLESSSGHSQPHNLLVNSFALGQSLAAAASAPGGTANATAGFNGTTNHHKVVLQRGHGFTATGTTMQEVVFNSIYTVENAAVLSTALAMGGSGEPTSIRALSQDEIQACTAMDFDTIPKVWPLWVAEVERNSFYKQTR